VEPQLRVFGLVVVFSSSSTPTFFIVSQPLLSYSFFLSIFFCLSFFSPFLSLLYFYLYSPSPIPCCLPFPLLLVSSQKPHSPFDFLFISSLAFVLHKHAPTRLHPHIHANHRPHRAKKRGGGERRQTHKPHKPHTKPRSNTP
jgi:hypothetical protein